MQHDLRRQDWGLVVSSVLGVAVTLISVALIPLSVFLKPLNVEFGWGRGEISLAITIMALSMAAAMPIAGALIDRFGVMRPALFSILAYAGGLAAFPTLIEHFGLAGLYAGACWIGLVGSASSSVIYVKVLSAVFDKSRGLALGFAMAGVPLGASVAPMIAVLLVENYSWAAGFHGLALLPVLIGIPMVLIVGARASALRAAVAAGTSKLPPIAGASVLEAMRTRGFLTMFVVFLIAAIGLHGIQIHLPSLLSDRGVSPELAVATLSGMFVVSLISRIACGYLFDRFFAPWVGAICFFLSAMGALLLLLPGTDAPQIMLAVVLLGIGTGAETDLLGLLVSRYFGTRAFAQIYGWLFGAFMIGSAIGPYVIGEAYDSAGSYGPALAWSGAGLFLAALLLASLPRFPQRFDVAARPVPAE